MNRIAFVTSEQWPALTPDDLLAAAAVARRGGSVAPAIWTRADVPWEDYDLVVLRSCWDYYERPAEFAQWLDDMQRRGIRVANDVATVRWNLDKRYLLDLAARGVDVIATELPRPGTSLERLMRERGWSTAVLKPCVSADGHRTMRIDVDDAAGHQAELEELIAGSGALVQEYIEEIGRGGELSFIFLGGQFSHCVRKRPAAGEFRVQARYGGTAEPWPPPSDLVEQAEGALRAAGRDALYARVDGCVVDGRLRLMELELIEPSLFLDLDAGAPDRLALAMLEQLATH